MKNILGLCLMYLLSSAKLYSQPVSGDALYGMLGKQLTAAEIEKLIIDFKLNMVQYSNTGSPENTIQLLRPFDKPELTLSCNEQNNTHITFKLTNKQIQSIDIDPSVSPYAGYAAQRFGISSNLEQMKTFIKDKSPTITPDGNWMVYLRWKDAEFSYFMRFKSTASNPVHQPSAFTVIYVPSPQSPAAVAEKPVQQSAASVPDMTMLNHELFNYIGKPVSDTLLRGWIKRYQLNGVKYVEQGAEGGLYYKVFGDTDSLVAHQKLKGGEHFRYISNSKTHYVNLLELDFYKSVLCAVKVNMKLSPLAETVVNGFGFGSYKEPSSSFVEMKLEKYKPEIEKFGLNDKRYKWHDSANNYELEMRVEIGKGSYFSHFIVQSKKHYRELKYINPEAVAAKTSQPAAGTELSAAAKMYACVSGDCTGGRGKANITGTSFYYEGSFKNGVPHGIGKLTFTGGAYAQGNFANNELHGEGMFDWGNGNKYIGSFVKGIPNGNGIYFEGANYYEGPVSNGILTCADCWRPKRNETGTSYINRQQWLLESIDRQRTQQKNLEDYQNAPTFMQWYEQRNY
ncbi:MAG: hypothetical protein POELPBGB_00510 [Bacteroidia bacterium]|nr:hypothetical protein [Bacteroidia bacterium]